MPIDVVDLRSFYAAPLGRIAHRSVSRIIRSWWLDTGGLTVAGLGYELTVIASVVIGGTSLFGGVGTIFGTVIGAVLIGVLLNGLVLLNVSSYIQQIVIGLIIVLAVAFDTFAKSRRRRA